MVYTRGSGVSSDPVSAAKYGRKAQQTSIFDPVLCEIMYKWFSKKHNKILDPFAGGSVRGLVCGMLDRYYTGIDLSNPQIEANKNQYVEISKKYSGIIEPKWLQGNSEDVVELTGGEKFDFIFSCPPYYNLEVYSTLDADLSYKDTYEDFLLAYRKIIAQCCSLLNDNSFACFVVGNLRNSTNGGYYDFVGDTVRAFQDAGLIYYNDLILVNVAGTLPIRTPIQFNSTRKVGKQHQNVLVFYKGDPNKIKEKFGSFEEENNEN